MNRFLKYVKSGEGIGARWLLLYAFVVAVVVGIGLKMMGNSLAPTLQNVAAQLLPVKIENGVIVEPQDTIKAVGLDIEGVEIPIVLDTTVDSIDVVGLKDGIYISRRALYAVNKNESKVYNFKDSITLENKDYTDLFKKGSGYVALAVGIFAFGFMFVLYLLVSIFYSIFAVIIGKIFKVSLDFSAAMRLSSVAYIMTSILMGLLRYSGLNTKLWLYVVAVVIIQTVVIKALAAIKE